MRLVSCLLLHRLYIWGWTSCTGLLTSTELPVSVPFSTPHKCCTINYPLDQVLHPWIPVASLVLASDASSCTQCLQSHWKPSLTITHLQVETFFPVVWIACYYSMKLLCECQVNGLAELYRSGSVGMGKRHTVVFQRGNILSKWYSNLPVQKYSPSTGAIWSKA